MNAGNVFWSPTISSDPLIHWIVAVAPAKNGLANATSPSGRGLANEELALAELQRSTREVPRPAALCRFGAPGEFFESVPEPESQLSSFEQSPLNAALLATTALEGLLIG